MTRLVYVFTKQQISQNHMEENLFSRTISSINRIYNMMNIGFSMTGIIGSLLAGLLVKLIYDACCTKKNRSPEQIEMVPAKSRTYQRVRKSDS